MSETKNIRKSIANYLAELDIGFKNNKIKKRNGTIEEFKLIKIYKAIEKAFGKKKCEHSIANVTYQVSHELFHFDGYEPNYVFDIEEIQDAVEMVLMKDYPKIAKKYIVYREQRRKAREDKKFDAEKVIKGYIGKKDWRVNENSNIDYSIGGLILHNSSAISSNYWLNEIYTKEIGDAHKNGDIHIHDLGYLTSYCAGWSLGSLIETGIQGVANKVSSSPAKHLSTLVQHMVNFMGTLQNEWAGAQAFSSVDTLLAPFVRYDNLSYEDVKQSLQQLIFGLNTPSRWGSQSCFSNFTFDLVPPKDLKERPVVVGGKWWKRPEVFMKEKGIDYCTNEMLVIPNSVPFDSEVFHTYADFQDEMDTINMAFIELMYKGDSNERPFSYPIPTYNITPDFNWNSEVAMMLFKMTGRYGTPYFQNFLNSDLDPSEVRSMCCRLRLDKRELHKRGGGLFGASEFTGSQGVVTINLPRIGMLVRERWEIDFMMHPEAYDEFIRNEFKKILKEKMDIARDSLELKKKTILKLSDMGMYPYTQKYLKHWNNHFLTIGLIGMNEALMNLFVIQGSNPQDKETLDITNKKAREFALDIMDFMRETVIGYQEESGNLYNLESTPAEGTCVSENTEINTNEGVKTISTMYNELKCGKDLYVFSMDENSLKLKLDKVKDIWITNESAKCVKITFDNGQTEIVTPNHLFGVKYFKPSCKKDIKCEQQIIWTRADELKQGQSIWSAYESLHNDKYKVLNSHTYIHKMVCEYKAPQGNDIKKLAGHHINYDKLDNSLDNIQVMTIKEHKQFHLKDTIHNPDLPSFTKQGEDNPFYGKKHSKESKQKIRESKKGIPFISTDNHKIACSIAAKNKPREKHSRFIRGIDEERIISLYKDGLSRREICNVTGYGYPLVQSRLLRAGALVQIPKNHKVVKIEHIDETYRVYDMETERYHNFFIGGTKGLLVHNCYRLAKIDKDMFGDKIITAGTKEAPYYTNSTQLPVDYTSDVFEALDHQDEFQTKYTGGTVLHCFIGEEIPDPQTVGKMVKAIASNYKLPYFTITPTYSICAEHGYLSGKQPTCPTCGKETEIYSRVVGYYRPVQSWNTGKKEEFIERQTFEVQDAWS